jgi:hypothetical protein
MATDTPFWLTDITAEAAPIVGGFIDGVPVKLFLNVTDIRCPRLVLRFPMPELVGCSVADVSPKLLTLMFVDLTPAIMKTGVQLGAKIVNFRVEGNVSVRPNATEPLTPHVHFVLRGMWQDPCFGNDYPLGGPGKVPASDLNMPGIQTFCQQFAYFLRENLMASSKANISQMKWFCPCKLIE